MLKINQQHSFIDICIMVFFIIGMLFIISGCSQNERKCFMRQVDVKDAPIVYACD